MPLFHWCTCTSSALQAHDLLLNPPIENSFNSLKTIYFSPLEKGCQLKNGPIKVDLIGLALELSMNSGMPPSGSCSPSC
jgi:hypothetical protein